MFMGKQGVRRLKRGRVKRKSEELLRPGAAVSCLITAPTGLVLLQGKDTGVIPAVSFLVTAQTRLVVL